LIEQGLKVFSSIHRRLYRSLKSEFEKIYRLNRLFLDPEVYFNILDEEGAVLQSDYEDESMDVTPVSDPNLASDAQRMARSRAQLDLIGMPGVNGQEIVKRFLEDLDTPNIEAIMPPPDPQAPPPPEALKMQAEIEEKAHKIKIEQEKVRLESMKLEAELKKLESEAIKNLAEAESKEAGSQLAQYKAVSDTLVSAKKLNVEQEKIQAGKEAPTTGE